jgi:hypothetical protein
MERKLRFILFLLGVLLIRPIDCFAQIYKFRSGLHLSREHQFSEKDRRLIEKRLGAATGFVDLSFAEDGKLTLGNRSFVDGSASARSLIEAVVDSKDSFILESTPNSSSIAFAHIESTLDYFDVQGEKHQAWHIRLDLKDFTKLRGSDKTLESFSPVMVLFHELGHGQLKLRDPLDALDALGDCERYVNEIRRELGLPLRDSYVPRSRQPLTASSEEAELRFATQSLRFELESVCGSCRERRSGEFVETWIARMR